MDEMIDRARRIVAQPWNYPTAVEWASALLAERAAREEAERRDSETRMTLGDDLARERLRVADLEAALRRAEQPHHARCAFVQDNDGCTCGLSAALAGGSDES